MSATNHTTYYGLSQFLGTDKPAWLVDYNGDMAAIDSAIKGVADDISGVSTTASSADSKADTNAQNITQLDTQINGASGLATDVVTLQGNINTINSLIGNGTPTTTDKTIIGAINEINAKIPEGGVSAEDVSFDGTSSGLQATNVQDAIDELAGQGTGTTVVTGTLTAGQTSVTLSDASILASSYIDVYTADGTPFVGAVQSVGSVVLTFEAQASNLAVAVIVRNF